MYETRVVFIQYTYYAYLYQRGRSDSLASRPERAWYYVYKMCSYVYNTFIYIYYEHIICPLYVHTEVGTRISDNVVLDKNTR